MVTSPSSVDLLVLNFCLLEKVYISSFPSVMYEPLWLFSFQGALRTNSVCVFFWFYAFLVKIASIFEILLVTQVNSLANKWWNNYVLSSGSSLPCSFTMNRWFAAGVFICPACLEAILHDVDKVILCFIFAHAPLAVRPFLLPNFTITALLLICANISCRYGFGCLTIRLLSSFDHVETFCCKCGSGSQVVDMLGQCLDMLHLFSNNVNFVYCYLVFVYSLFVLWYCCMI